MEATDKKVVLLVGLMAAIACCTDAQQTFCNAPISGLVTCRPAVTPPNPPPPVAMCCDALRHADWKCLCQYKDSPLAPRLHISPKLALELPEKCKLPHPAPC